MMQVVKALVRNRLLWQAFHAGVLLRKPMSRNNLALSGCITLEATDRLQGKILGRKNLHVEHLST